ARYQSHDARRARSLDQLRSAGLIYIGGGVTNALLSTLRGSLAEEAIREAAGNGTVIAAIAAAAASFGIHARDMQSPASALPALGWIAQTVIDTGFDPQDDPMQPAP